MEKKVLTEEEIKNIASLREEFNSLTYSAGEIEIQIMNLSMQKEEKKSQFKSLQQREQQAVMDLENKYGKGTISLETGEFLPNS